MSESPSERMRPALIPSFPHSLLPFRKELA
jgi:hypothetical protein